MTDHDWRIESIMPQVHHRFTLIRRCGRHPGPQGRAFHREMVDGVSRHKLYRMGLIRLVEYGVGWPWAGQPVREEAMCP